MVCISKALRQLRPPARAPQPQHKQQRRHAQKHQRDVDARASSMTRLTKSLVCALWEARLVCRGRGGRWHGGWRGKGGRGVGRKRRESEGGRERGGRRVGNEYVRSGRRKVGAMDTKQMAENYPNPLHSLLPLSTCLISRQSRTVYPPNRPTFPPKHPPTSYRGTRMREERGGKERWTNYQII